MVGLLALAAACADRGGTPERAKAMVERAAEFMEANGRDETLAELSKSDGRFVEGDLYVFAYDLKGTVVAHPLIPSLIGQNLLGKPDSQGKLFRDEINELAKTQGSGWVEYTYVNPATGQEGPKTTYVLRSGDLVLCGGAYR
jgi:signal transduction histidine kinase